MLDKLETMHYNKDTENKKGVETEMWEEAPPASNQK